VRGSLVNFLSQKVFGGMGLYCFRFIRVLGGLITSWNHKV
jgi:hypothetical protein